MITYALSSCAFGNTVTPETAEAIRKSQFRNFEPYFGVYIEDNEDARISREQTLQLIREKVFRSASVHLPFYGKESWDSSSLDEEERKDVSARMIRVIRDNAEMMGPMVTLHSSRDVPQEEHPKRIGQVCKTIEEMLPTAQELGFVINVEFLPDTIVGNSAEELMEIVSRFDPGQVGICLDVNHIMDRGAELPQMIDFLAPRIRSFHICDYDGINEAHWLPGQGVHNWPLLMKHIRAIDHDLVLILETAWQLKWPYRKISPYFSMRQNERAVWYLENCDRLYPEMEAFRVPGQQL